MSKKGFTLVELLAVIGIIGILAAIILPKFTNYVDKAYERKVLSDLRAINMEMVSHYAENGDYISPHEFNGTGTKSNVLKRLKIKGELTYQDYDSSTTSSPNKDGFCLDRFWYYDDRGGAFGFWDNKFHREIKETGSWEVM